MTTTDLDLDVNAYIAERARVKIAQIRPKISQIEIGRALGIEQQHVSKRMNGHTRFRVEDVVRLAALFDCDVSELLPPVEALPPASPVTRQSHAPHNSPAVSTERLPIQRLRSPVFIPSQQAA